MPTLSLSSPLAAQDDSEALARLTIVPTVGFTFEKERYIADEPIAGGTSSRSGTLGPTSGTNLGLDAEVFLSPSWALVVGGAVALGINYDLRFRSPVDDIRTITGKQDVIRLRSGLQYRVRPNAPGFFAGGIIVNVVSPAEGADPANPGSIAPGDQDRTEVGAYLGLGLDLGTENKLRVSFRVAGLGVRADQSIERPEVTYRPREFVVDYSVTLGFLLPIL